jgi:hypothetical protein
MWQPSPRVAIQRWPGKWLELAVTVENRGLLARLLDDN